MKKYQIVDSSSATPFVSIAMLAYNHELYIAEAIESVLMQKTSFDYKIIIAEDYSTDTTRQIIENYQKRYPEKFKLILQNSNVGAQKNNIDLLTNLEGKYIAALEGDDYWTDPLKLQKQVDFLEANTDFGLVCTNYSSSDTQREYEESRELFLKDILKDSQIGTVTALFKTNLIANYFKGEAALDLSMADFPLWIYISRLTKIFKLQDCTAFYRILENSASGRNNFAAQKKFALDVLKVVRKNIKLISSTNDKDEILRERYGQLFKILIESKDKEFINYNIAYFKIVHRVKLIDLKILIKGFLKIYVS